MSGVTVIRHLLASDAAILALVPDTRIMGGPLPLKTALPAIGVSRISTVERTTVSMAGTRKMQTQRVQVTIHAATYLQQGQLVGLVRLACINRNGTVNGVDLDSILPGGEGPDGFEPDPGIYQQTMDFIVKWRAA